MAKNYRIISGVCLAIALIALVLTGYYLFKEKQIISDFLNKSLPSVSTTGNANLSGKLFGPLASNRAADLSADKILEWTNYYREQNGADPLTMNETLVRAAQSKVTDIFTKQYFEHVSPSGLTPAQLVLAAGYNYKFTGENLALGDFKDEKDLVDAWMNSPGHRANILNPDYTEIGVSSGLNQFEERGTTWVSVQEFGRPAPQCTKPSQTLFQTFKDKEAEYEILKVQYDNLASQKKLSREEYDEAIKLQDQLNSLYYEINPLVDEYNLQVNSYNTCIKS